MYLNWFGITCGVVGIVAFFIGYVIAKKWPSMLRPRFACLFGLWILPGASFTLYYLHWFEVPEWYYEFRALPFSETGLVVMGGAVGVLASAMHPAFRVLALLMTALFGIVPFSKPFLAPFHEGAFKDLWDGIVCRQSTYSTCGAAAATSLLKHHGLSAREETLAQEAYSYQGGTEIWYLARALKRRGLVTDMHVRKGLPAIFETNDQPNTLPAIAGVKFGHTGHFIVVLSRESDRFHIGDPLRGSEVLSRSELMGRYQFTGFSMTVTRPFTLNQ